MLVSGMKVGKTGGARLEVDGLTGPHLPNIVLLQYWARWDVASCAMACLLSEAESLACVCMSARLSICPTSLTLKYWVGVPLWSGVASLVSFEDSVLCCAVLCRITSSSSGSYWVAHFSLEIRRACLAWDGVDCTFLLSWIMACLVGGLGCQILFWNSVGVSLCGGFCAIEGGLSVGLLRVRRP